MSTTLGPAELRSILAFTVSLARTAGTLILEGSQAIQASSDVNEKKNSVDLVTQYDVAVENLVMSEIKKAYPAFKLYVTFLMFTNALDIPDGSIGEESFSGGTHPVITDEPTFCVDPIGKYSLLLTTLRQSHLHQTAPRISCTAFRSAASLSV